MKLCSKCAKSKELTEFYNGRPECKSCAKQYAEDNKESISIRMKKYRSDNRVHLDEQRKAWESINKEAHLAQRREFYQNNKDRLLDEKKWKSIKNNYGLSKSAYEKMLKLQSHKCLICGVTFNSESRSDRCCVDHDHSKEPEIVVRGLLCSYCNLALGLFRDDVDSLKKAIKYLEVVR